MRHIRICIEHSHRLIFRYRIIEYANHIDNASLRIIHCDISINAGLVNFTAKIRTDLNARVTGCSKLKPCGNIEHTALDSVSIDSKCCSILNDYKGMACGSGTWNLHLHAIILAVVYRGSSSRSNDNLIVFFGCRYQQTRVGPAGGPEMNEFGLLAGRHLPHNYCGKVIESIEHSACTINIWVVLNVDTGSIIPFAIVEGGCRIILQIAASDTFICEGSGCLTYIRRIVLERNIKNGCAATDIHYAGTINGCRSAINCHFRCFTVDKLDNRRDASCNTCYNRTDALSIFLRALSNCNCACSAGSIASQVAYSA